MMSETIASPESAVLTDQHGHTTALRTAPVTFDVEEYQGIINNAKALEEKERTVSVVPKYYEFTSSLEEVQKAAEKKKGDEREEYLKMNVPETICKGIFQGVSLEEVSTVDEETGEVSTRTRKIAKWVTAEGLFISFGAQLVRVLEPLPIGIPVEIQYVRKEPVKSIPGATVKIYEVYPLI